MQSSIGLTMESVRGRMKAILSGLLGAVIWGGLVVPASSAQTSPDVSISATASRQLEERGFDGFYSLEYDQAIAIFEKLRDSEPDNPAWYNDLAAAYFYRKLHTVGALQGDLFAGSNRFFRMKRIPPDEAFEEKFHDANQKAISLCEKRLSRNNKDQTALYDCGVAYADRAAYLGLVERAKFETLANARKASEYHSKLARLNPQFYDAYLIPGLYQYVLGSLPGSLKFLLFFAGLSGEKEKGIQAVEATAKWGSRSKQDAKILLAVMYRREKRHDEARRTLMELADAYPRNYIFPLEVASVYRSAGQEQEAIRVYEQVLTDIHDGRAGFAEAPLARIHYELAELYWKAGNLESAKSHIEQVNGARGTNQELETQNGSMRRQVEEAMRQRQPGPTRPVCCTTP